MRSGWKAALALAALGLGGGAYWYLDGPLPGFSSEQAEQRPERPPPVVAVAEARTEAITRTAEAVGTVRATESVTLTAKATGRIETIAFADGDRVRRNEVLVQLEQTELRAELATVEAEALEVEQQLARQTELLARGAGPRAAVDDSRRRFQAAQARIAAARKRLGDTAIRAPFDGRVGLRDVSVGALIEPGTALATLDAVAPIDLRFTVPEQLLGELKLGAKIKARSSAYPERSFEGEVRAVDSRVDEAARTLTVEARLPNPDAALRPGMLMSVELTLGRVADAVVVPPLSVQVRGDEQFVFRVVEDKAERVKVRLGQREPDRVQILEGLKAGDRIVIEGTQSLNDGQAVRIKGQEDETSEPREDPRKVADRRPKAEVR